MAEEIKTEITGTVFSRLAQVAAMIGPVKKKQPKPGGGISYAFRGIDDLMNNLQPIFATAGLFLIPDVIESHSDVLVQTGKDGKDQYVTRCNLQMRWTIYAADGSSVSGSMPGHASDYADKATNKAISASLKYFLMDVFMIPTEDIADSDHENPEIKPDAKRASPPVVDKYTGEPRSESPADEAASDKQLGMIKFLLSKKEIGAEEKAKCEKGMNAFSVKTASSTIEWLTKKPDKVKS